MVDRAYDNDDNPFIKFKMYMKKQDNLSEIKEIKLAKCDDELLI